MSPAATAASRPNDAEAFIDRAHALGVDSVSLESCFVPRYDADYLAGTVACVFFIGDRYVGTLPAFAPVRWWKITSSRAVQVFKDLTPGLYALIKRPRAGNAWSRCENAVILDISRSCTSL